ncbi:MAG: flagellar filament capping protein FliD [Gammaproteobacteria bacterium]|nr:flagellar filament capping protein FliD [Gammaproteobacteria bacterium]
MATIQSAGLGSGIDVESLVTQLVAVERAPQAQRLQRASTKVTTQLSALGTLRGALSTLQTSVAGLKTASSFQGRKAESTDKSVFTASAGTTAATGSYSIEVKQLASAQKLASAAYPAGPTTAVGTGTLTLTAGGKVINVTIGEASNTLAGIRDAINAAPDNDKVQATLIQAADGARLVLTSRQSGVGNAIQVTATGGDGGLDALTYQAGGSSGLTQIAAAQDAEVLVEGFTVRSATNTVADAMDGVTLNLLQAKPGTTYQLAVGADESATREKIRKFVTDLNTATSALAKLRSYDASTQSAGPLLGDSMLRGIEESLRRQLQTSSSTATAPYNSLNSIGVRVGADGSYSIDETKLSAALAADFDGVGRLFGGIDGVATRIHDVLERALRSDGQVAARSTSLENQKKAITQDTAALDARMVSVEARYRAQFIAMDKLLTSLQSTSSYLAQNLSGSSSG